MINDLVHKVRMILHHSVVKNAASLYVLKFANYIVPLLLVPYLVRVLGPSGYGAVAFAQSLTNYVMLLVGYGFDLSATRKISVCRSNLDIVNYVATHVWIAKSLLAIVGAGLLCLAGTLLPKVKEVAPIVVVLYGTVIGNVLFPTWLFQGMERMATLSYVNLVIKVGIATGVLFLVRRPEDIVVYAGLSGGGSLLAGVIGMAAAVRLFNLKCMPVSAYGVLQVLREGWTLFLSQAAVSLYTVGNAFLLGLLTSYDAVGFYTSAEKLTKSLWALFGPFSQAIYPKFSKLAAESRELAISWGRRVLLLVGGAACVLSITIIVCAPVIVPIVLGPEYSPSIPIVRALAPTLFFIALSNVLGVQMMLPLGMDKAFTLILAGAGVLNVGGALILASRWQALGMALSVLVSEFVVSLSMFVYLRLRGIDVIQLGKGWVMWKKDMF